MDAPETATAAAVPPVPDGVPGFVQYGERLLAC